MHGIRIIATCWSTKFESGEAAFLREMASELGYHPTLIFILKVSRFKKFKLHSFKRDVQEMDTNCKNYKKLSSNVNDFLAILYDNSEFFSNLNFLFLVQLFMNLEPAKVSYLIQKLRSKVKNSGFIWKFMFSYFVAHNEQIMSHFAHEYV